MRWRGNGRAFTLSAALLLAACTAPARHRTLTFFFDGVPPLPTPAPPAVTSTASGAADVPLLRPRQHGPFSAKLCDDCHAPGRGNALLLPAERLCSRCHEIELSKPFVHGPLVAGGCSLCHDPHESRYPFLLVSASETFCMRCHAPADLRPIEGHSRGAGACLSCHEAHMSDRRFLLR